MKVKIKTLTLIVTITWLTLFLSNFSFSQESETAKKNEEVRGYLMLGGSQLDLDALNDRLMRQGHASFSDEFFSIGGGFLREKSSNWLVGIEGHVLLVDEQDYILKNVTHRAALTVAQGFFDIGYNLVSLGGLNIYPLIGIGGGGAWLQIGKNNFDNILEAPQGNAKLTGSAFMLNFALGSDYLIKIKASEQDETGIVLGFRAGYTYSPWQGAWSTDSISIEGGPKVGMTGPYVRLMLGFGGKGEWWKEEKNKEEIQAKIQIFKPQEVTML